MSIVITNISNTFSEKGLQVYVLKINNKEICRFTHVRADGLSQCLYRAYLETGGDDYIGDLIAKLADADAEIKRLGEFEDYYIRTHKHVYVAAIVQPYEEKIKVLEAEVEGLKCCGNCVHHYRPDLAPKCEAMFDFCYCDNWTPDGLTRERRKYGLADE